MEVEELVEEVLAIRELQPVTLEDRMKNTSQADVTYVESMVIELNAVHIRIPWALNVGEPEVGLFLLLGLDRVGRQDTL